MKKDHSFMLMDTGKVREDSKDIIEDPEPTTGGGFTPKSHTASSLLG